MQEKENKGAEEALSKELKEMEAADGEFGEVESLERLIPDDEAEDVAGGLLCRPRMTIIETTEPGWTPGPYRW